VSALRHRIQSFARWMLEFFTDDGVNAFLTIVWVAIILVIARSVPGQVWAGVLLAGGLSAIFFISIVLRVRRARR
jgi:hypothetical protein